ncbi:MAG: hypothetical protein C4K60_14180 [Ideonella sp. MAG2]|nr:MAG: hypothetical protein C4K60_14180 [Ideonella sp. MAG2]
MRTGRAVAATAVCLALLGSAAAWAQAPAPAPKIFSCVDKNGRRLSADRPIAECQNQEQKLLNRDGSVRAIARPLASPEETARLEAQRQAALQSQAQQEDAQRKERQLVRRYPNEQAHAQARARALEPVLRQLGESKVRIQALERERETLVQQIKVEKKPAVAEGVRQRLEANEVALQAQVTGLRDREAERERMSQQFDQELAHLKALWAAPPASGGIAR